MPTTNDADKFESRWNDHIAELRKIGLSLPAQDIPELNQNIENLEDLVETAASEVGGDD